MFLENLGLVSKQVLILYLIVAVGFFADRFGKYTEKAARLTTDLLFYIITPCVIMESFMSVEFSVQKLTALLISFGCGVMTYGLGVLFSRMFFRRSPGEKQGIYRHAMVYGNCGFLALPLARAVLGPEGVFYCSIGIVVFYIFVFTHGVWQMNEDEGKSGISLKHIFVNPGTIGIVLGLPLFLFGIHLPEVIEQPVAFIGSMNTPLAMLILGTYLSNTDLKTTFSGKDNYLIALGRLILIPGTLLILLKVLRVPQTIAIAAMISACPPSATNTVMFTAKFNKDTGVASKAVAATTSMGILTMPLMLALTQQVI